MAYTHRFRNEIRDSNNQIHPQESLIMNIGKYLGSFLLYARRSNSELSKTPK